MKKKRWLDFIYDFCFDTINTQTIFKFIPWNDSYDSNDRYFKESEKSESEKRNKFYSLNDNLLR